MKIKQSTSVKLNEQEIELILSIFTTINEQSIGFNKLKLDKDETAFINQFLKIFKSEQSEQSQSIQTISDIGYNPLGSLTDLRMSLRNALNFNDLFKYDTYIISKI